MKNLFFLCFEKINRLENLHFTRVVVPASSARKTYAGTTTLVVIVQAEPRH